VPTATPTAVPGACIDDCEGDGQVTIDDLMKGVNLVLGILPPDECASFDRNRDGFVTIDELVMGVNNALFGCGQG
jgi:hypothetical protein